MTRVITVASGKGGVGKTTLVANLAAALALYGKSVVALDANLTTSNLGLHLGIHLYPKTLHDVLEGRAAIREATYQHKTGFRVIPADISLRKIRNVKSNDFVDVFYKLMEGTDFLLIDSAAGLGREARASIEAADEMITITNPELPAVTDAMKLGLLAEKFETHNLGVVVNRIKKESHEVPIEHIEEMLGVPVIGRIPEDREVRKSIALKEPVVYHNPKSFAAQHMRSVAATLIGEEYAPRKPMSLRLFGWLVR
ncbi:MAG: P-loop NTPase [Candidatus Aenigmarchaeota archaeon]|nr:P-loop NTPase [Candidatus Aenigmarchaeota archaeon]NIP39920.1 P-loop NTPase [Candidatus Aenigmarchaeota archaeon]NIQ17639.1 P-loop NTPase [Candidatus Aenigmarchaeota archaeon]NIS72827.1 P-loop NTPase [Candidatus Aenigmarchaeota archaeon]